VCRAAAVASCCLHVGFEPPSHDVETLKTVSGVHLLPGGSKHPVSRVEFMS
jgi:hypothetical protein